MLKCTHTHTHTHAGQVVGSRVDRIIAHMLQYSDEQGGADKEEIQLGMKQVGAVMGIVCVCVVCARMCVYECV